MRYFLDVNVVMYAGGRDHPYRDRCRAVLRALAEGRLEAVTDTEVVQEILYYFWRTGELARGVRMARDLLELLPPDRFLAVTVPDVARAVELLETYGPLGVSPRDCIHAAVMERAGVRYIISADADFDRMEGLVRVDPRQLEV